MLHDNAPYIISYILSLLFFIIGGIFFRQSFIALFIILLIILPIISYFLFKHVVKKISIDISAKTYTVAKGNKIALKIDCTNKSFLPLLNVKIALLFQNNFYPNEQLHTISVPSIPKKTISTTIEFDTGHLGINDFNFVTYSITDFLHLFSHDEIINKTIQIPVVPNDSNVTFKYSIPPFSYADEDDQFVTYGQQTHDLKETREYRPGDLLKNIHWKLSAKNDDLTVKVFEKSVERTLLLLPELCNEDMDLTIQALYDFSIDLIKKKEYFKILIFSAKEKEFDEVTIESVDTLDKAILQLYHCSLYDMKQFALNTYFEIFGSDKPIIHVLMSDVLFINKDSGEKILLSQSKTNITEN